MKTLEEVQHKGRQSEKRVQDLEVENQELKMKLVEEEEDDQVIVQSWDSKVKVLEHENQELQRRLEDEEEEDSLQMKRFNDRIDELLAENNELKSAIAQLEAQVVMVSPNPNPVLIEDQLRSGKSEEQQSIDQTSIPIIKLDLLKQKINQLVVENDELRSTIARLRWANHRSESESEVEVDDPTITDEMADKVLEEQLEELRQLLSSEQNESKMWREMYEKLRLEMIDKMSKEGSKGSTNSGDNGKNANDNNIFDENQIYDWIFNSTNVLKEALVKGSGVVGDRLKAMFHKISENESIFSGEVLRGINSTQSVLFELSRQLQDKWQELQDLRTAFADGSQKISTKMSKLLDRTIRKLQEASNKLLSTNEEDIDQKVEHFSNHISKLIKNLDKKWNNLFNKLSDRYYKQSSNSESSTEDKDKQSSDPKTNWFFERAKSRREEQMKTRSASQTQTDDRLKSDYEYNRIVIEESDDTDSDDSGVDEEPEEGVNWFLRKAKKTNVNDDSNEFESHRRRRMKYKTTKQFAHRFEYNSRYSRQR